MKWLERDRVVALVQEANPALLPLWRWLEQRDPTIEVIEGNHDTSEPNRYLDAIFAAREADGRRRVLEDLNEEPVASEEDSLAELADPFLSQAVCDQRLIYEHGDACDRFNNDQDFYRNERGRIPGGYFSCRKREVELLDGPDWLHPLQDQFANPSLDRACRRRARRIFEANPQTRVVVFGHTHSSLIESLNGVIANGSPRIQLSRVPMLELKAGEIHPPVRHEGVDLGAVYVRCHRGRIRITLSTEVGDAVFHRDPLDVSVESGPQNLEFSEADPVWPQNNVLEIAAIEDATCTLIMRSVDREGFRY